MTWPTWTPHTRGPAGQRRTASLQARVPIPGTVYLVGAGPGDPELITVRGLRCLHHAGVVLYDRLTHPSLLDETPLSARRIFVGKAPGRPGVGQEAIHRLMIDHARRGTVVVRLKGGDPFVFGRGGEEAEALSMAGIPWAVVPAVSSALGVPALSGIPVTHRGLARCFAVVTGHQIGDSDLDWDALVAMDTLVVLMGLGRLAAISRKLIAHGRDPQTPAAVIARGTLPEEHVVTATLADLPSRVAAEEVRPPATFVIGDVVGLRQSLIEAVLEPAARRRHA